jgi:hypothetical protein
MQTPEIIEKLSPSGKPFWMVRHGRYLSAPTSYREEAERWVYSISVYDWCVSARFLPEGA